MVPASTSSGASRTARWGSSKSTTPVFWSPRKTKNTPSAHNVLQFVVRVPFSSSCSKEWFRSSSSRSSVETWREHLRLICPSPSLTTWLVFISRLIISTFWRQTKTIENYIYSLMKCYQLLSLMYQPLSFAPLLIPISTRILSIVVSEDECAAMDKVKGGTMGRQCTEREFGVLSAVLSFEDYRTSSILSLFCCCWSASESHTPECCDLLC